MKRIYGFLAILALCLPLGCSDFERTAFQTLSADKAVIDDAAAGYEARTLPHTPCVKHLIEDARAADAIAVRAMGTYEVAKSLHSPTDEAIAGVEQSLANLVPILANIKTLSTVPCGGGK